MNGSTNPSAIRSKTEICEALIRLMKDHPYEEITVKQIALEAKLVRKTFYRNFDSKEDVLETILDKLIAIPVKLEELMAFGFVPTEFFCGFDPSYQILFNIGGIWNVICRWAHGGMEDDPKQLIEELSKYIVTLGEYAKKGVSPFQKVAK